MRSRDTNVQGQSPGQVVKGQGHSVEMLSDRQIIVFFQEIGVANSNGDVIILIGNNSRASRSLAKLV